jgi:hypothetical protein
MGRMLAMIGTLPVGDARSVEALGRRMHSYQTIRVSASQRVVLIPPIGSFLVDWDSAAIRLHIAGKTQRDLDELMEQLNEELTTGPNCFASIEWTRAAAIPVPFR